MDFIGIIEKLEEAYKTTKNPAIAANLSQLFFEASKRAVNKSEVDYCITSAIILFQESLSECKEHEIFREPVSGQRGTICSPVLISVRRESLIRAGCPLKQSSFFPPLRGREF